MVGDRAITGSAASASQMGRFETKWLRRPENLAALADLPGRWIHKVHQRRPPKIVVLEMDSSESPTYGEQEGGAYNGHFGCTCYHPLFVFNQLGDVERCALRSGNVHSADGWRAVLEPVIARYRGNVSGSIFEGTRPSPIPRFTSSSKPRTSATQSGCRPIASCRTGSATCSSGPVGRPPLEVRRYYASFSYQAQNWKKARRVVAKVEWHPGELYPRVGFIVTNLSRPAERIVAFYNQRGTCEQWIKEGKGAIKWIFLAVMSFFRRQRRPPSAPRARLQPWQLHAHAGDVEGSGVVVADQPAEKLIKYGAKVTSHGRYVTFQMAEVAVPRRCSPTSCR